MVMMQPSFRFAPHVFLPLACMATMIMATCVTKPLVPGDLISIGTGVETPDMNGRADLQAVVMSGDAQRPRGSTCLIDVGPTTHAEGSLLILARAEDGDYLAHWQAASAPHSRSECSRSADVVIPAQDVNALRRSQALDGLIALLSLSPSASSALEAGLSS